MPRKPKRPKIVDLLLALRDEGIVCTTITADGVTLDGIMWLAQDDSPSKKPEPRLSMWEQQVEAVKNLPTSPNTEVPPETLLE